MKAWGRHWQAAVAPVALPPLLRARLDRVKPVCLAERFRREEIFGSYRPKLAIALAQDHMAVAGDVRREYYEPALPGKSPDLGRWRDTWRDALQHTKGQHGSLQAAHLGRAFDEQDIRDYAENYARICSKMTTREHREDFTESLGVEPPQGRNLTSAGACARMDDPQWWRRKLRAVWTRAAENVMRELGIVRKGREPYASDDAVMARHVQRERGRRFLEGHEATNEIGEQLSLLKLAEHSTANPAIRRAEFMTRVSGFEEIASTAGHVAQFWTLTCPSAFHAQLAAGVKNPNFQRFIVREGQKWLCKQWARARAKLKRLSILIYGFRIAEPHHDGTPHWHLLLFCRPADALTIERVIRGYWLKEFENEQGAQQHRVECIAIESTKGSAAGYVAKYVAKNIDAAGEIGEATDEETGVKVADGVRRVDAWAALHGIRQFQQVGGPPVGLWRELRRLTESSDDPDLERIRARADLGDWAGFIWALSDRGIHAGRRVACKLERLTTGELTKYTEEGAPRVVGVRYASAVEVTRPHHWRIKKCSAPSAETNRNPVQSAKQAPVNTAAIGLLGLCLNPELWQRPRRRRRPIDPPALHVRQMHEHEKVRTHRPWVMNPPRSPALGREARNPKTGHAMAVDHGRSGSGGGATAAVGLFSSGSGSDSDLGPVAITVRGARADKLPREGPEKGDT